MFDRKMFVSGMMTLVFVSVSALAKQEAKPMKLFTPGEVEWKLDEKSGMSTSTQWGNPKTGPSAGLIKFPKGWAAPLHHHNAEHVFATVSGTFILTDEKGNETRLPVGSTGTVPAKTKHSTKCAEDTDCVIFGYVNGKDDMVPAQKTAAIPSETTHQ